MCVSVFYVGNPRFGMHCHPLDSVNPGFIWRTPLATPWIALDSRTGIHKMGKKESRFGIVCLAARIAHVGSVYVCHVYTYICIYVFIYIYMYSLSRAIHKGEICTHGQKHNRVTCICVSVYVSHVYTHICICIYRYRYV